MRNYLLLFLTLVTACAFGGCVTQEQQRCQVLWQNVAGVEGQVTGERGSKAQYAYAAFPVDEKWHALVLAPPEMPDTLLLLTYRADQRLNYRTVDDRLRAWIAHEDQAGTRSGLVEGQRLHRWQALLARAQAGQIGEPLRGQADIHVTGAEHISVKLDLATTGRVAPPGQVTGEVLIERKTTSPVLEAAGKATTVVLLAPVVCVGVIIFSPVLIAWEFHH